MSDYTGWLTKAFVLALLAGIGICFWELAAGSPSPRESILFGTGLTVLSMGASWFTSKFYSEQSYNKNLQTFGLKASEKVNNLSNELSKLSLFLQQELDSDADEPAAEALLSKRLKIEAAIHVLGTLKTMNEGSLSDWQAVVGEEISEQKQMQEEKEETLREVVEMVKSLPSAASERKDQHPQLDDEGTAELQKDIESIRNEIRTLATQVSGVPFKTVKFKARKEKIEKECPRCAKKIEYTQRTKPNSIKAFACPHCGVPLYSRERGGVFFLGERKPLDEKVACLNCGLEAFLALDPVPGSTANFVCDKCQAEYRAVRRAKDINLKRASKGTAAIAPAEISEELMIRIRDSMGPQPWPRGKSRAVASQLGMSHAIVDRAVEQLVSRGDFRLQVNGKLYQPIQTTPNK
jgi:Zn finger protein HypA/HybF involved in hydrogenase expression